VIETYVRWQPVFDVDSPCAHIVLCTNADDLSIRLCFSAVQGAAPRDLLLRFGSDVLASMSHDEFVHPWNAGDPAGDVPRLGHAWPGFAFPLLEVQDSRWLASFSDSQISDDQRVAARHLRFVSLDNTVDVLTLGEIGAAWVAPAP
jgi:hypothetical protein